MEKDNDWNWGAVNTIASQLPANQKQAEEILRLLRCGSRRLDNRTRLRLQWQERY
jgi:hypothetical protein